MREPIAWRAALQFVIIVGHGINEVDSTREDVLHPVTEHLSENGIVARVANMKRPVVHDTRPISHIGEQDRFTRVPQVMDSAWDSLGGNFARTTRPPGTR